MSIYIKGPFPFPLCVPQRNTVVEIETISNELRDHPIILNELFEEALIVKAPYIFWCEDEDCLEVIEPFNFESELEEHMCLCHPCHSNLPDAPESRSDAGNDDFDAAVEMTVAPAIDTECVDITKGEIALRPNSVRGCHENIREID